MKQLRILTGLHAGARLRLTPGCKTLGSEPEADIQVTDWTQPTVRLLHDEGEEAMQLLSLDGAAPAAAGRLLLMDFAPQRFADVVLCIGSDDDSAWPSDVELLTRLLKPAAAALVPAGAELPARRLGLGVGTTTLAGGMACAMLLGFGAVMMQSTRRAEARMAPEMSLQARVVLALKASGVRELTVRNAEPKVVVEGLVAAAPDLVRVRAALAPFDPSLVVRRFAAASEIANSLTDAFADPELHVRYGGQGVFVVEGATHDLERLRGSAGRIAADLGEVVRRIDIAARELPPEHRVHTDAMLVSPGLRYVQTRDGTKHLIVSDTEDPDAAPGPTVH